MRSRFIFFFALALVGCGSACSPIPEIGRDLPSNYLEGERVFDARLKAKFPVGTDAYALAEELKRQGFLVRNEAEGGSATFSDKRFPVSSVWNVGWEIKEGRITRIWGVYGGRGP
jgi:hypothetical protein